MIHLHICKACKNVRQILVENLVYITRESQSQNFFSPLRRSLSKLPSNTSFETYIWLHSPSKSLLKIGWHFLSHMIDWLKSVFSFNFLSHVWLASCANFFYGVHPYRLLTFFSPTFDYIHRWRTFPGQSGLANILSCKNFFFPSGWSSPISPSYFLLTYIWLKLLDIVTYCNPNAHEVVHSYWLVSVYSTVHCSV